MKRKSGSIDEMPADELLLARACRGDTAAFEALYKQYVGRVYGLCLRMTRAPAIAEDCTQEAFINAWRGLKSFESRSSFGTWLHRIAVNAVIARGRRGELVMVREDAQPDPDDCSPAAQAEPMALEDLEQMLGKLPEGARNVVVLYGVYGYSHEETAGLLGIAVGTCKAQLHRARQLLKGHLHAEGWV